MMRTGTTALTLSLSKGAFPAARASLHLSGFDKPVLSEIEGLSLSAGGVA